MRLLSMNEPQINIPAVIIITDAFSSIFLISFNQKMPSFPVLMLLLKFISSMIRSYFVFTQQCMNVFRIFSVTTSLASVFNRSLTAVNIVSSSMINTLAFLISCLWVERFESTMIVYFRQIFYYCSIEWIANCIKTDIDCIETEQFFSAHDFYRY